MWIWTDNPKKKDAELSKSKSAIMIEMKPTN